MKRIIFKEEAERLNVPQEAVVKIFYKLLDERKFYGIIDTTEFIGFTSEEIDDLIKLLDSKPVQVNELAKELNLTTDQLRRIIDKLLDEDRIKGLLKEEEFVPQHVITEEAKESKRYIFLSDDEEVIRELESGWQCVRHGRKFEWSKSMFRFELLRKPVLTNKRLLLLKGEEIDHEILIEDVESLESDTAGAGNPYLRMELKNGEAISLAFGCISPKMFLGVFYLLGKSRSIVDQWVQSINNLILLRKLKT